MTGTAANLTNPLNIFAVSKVYKDKIYTFNPNAGAFGGTAPYNYAANSTGTFKFHFKINKEWHWD